MHSDEEHLDDLIRHITLVRNACVLLGRRLAARGQKVFGRQLIARGHVHDASKFFGTEWNWLHAGPDVPADRLAEAVEQHVETNDHHPEYWGGVNGMPPVAVAEMVCDWYARSQEFGTGLRDWIRDAAVERYAIAPDSQVRKLIDEYVGILLQDSFKR